MPYLPALTLWQVTLRDGDGFTTNIWALSTTTGKWRQITDFGERATFVARRLRGPPMGIRFSPRLPG